MIDLTHWAVRRRARAVRGGIDREGPAVVDGQIVGHTASNVPVVFERQTFERSASRVVFGMPGSGKTIMTAGALVAEMAAMYHDRQPEERGAFLIVDPKSDLVEAVLAGISAVEPSLLDQVAYLDPFVPTTGGFPFGLHRAETGAMPEEIWCRRLAECIAEISNAGTAQPTIGAAGARQRLLIEAVLQGVMGTKHLPDSTFLLALDALEPGGLTRLAKITNSGRAKQTLLASAPPESLRVSCYDRMRLACATPGLEHMLSAPTCISFRELLGPGRICLVDLSRPFGIAALQRFFAQWLTALAFDVLMARSSGPDAPHHTVRVVVDECQVIARILGESEELLRQGRAKGISLTALSQGTAALEDNAPGLLQTLLVNARTRWVGKLSARDAELFAHELAPAPGSDEHLSAIREKFITSATNLPEREFIEIAPGVRRRFLAAPVPLDDWFLAREREADRLADVRTRLQLRETTAPRRTLTDFVPSGTKSRAAGSGSDTSTATARKPARSRWG